jgi:hypothetical protein
MTSNVTRQEATRRLLLANPAELTPENVERYLEKYYPDMMPLTQRYRSRSPFPSEQLPDIFNRQEEQDAKNKAYSEWQETRVAKKVREEEGLKKSQAPSAQWLGVLKEELLHPALGSNQKPLKKKTPIWADQALSMIAKQRGDPTGKRKRQSCCVQEKRPRYKSPKRY